MTLSLPFLSKRKNLVVHVGVNHARESFRMQKKIYGLKKPRVPYYGKCSPVAIALGQVTNTEDVWSVSNTNVVMTKRDGNGFYRTKYLAMDPRLKEYLLGKRKIPFTFNVEIEDF